MKDRKATIEIPVLVLLCIAALCVILIIAGTVYAFATKSARTFQGTAYVQRRTEPPAPDGTETGSGGTAGMAFADTGHRRIMLKPDEDERSVLLIVKASIPYTKDDTPIHEEIMKSMPKIQETMDEYFSAFTLEELRATDESEMKRELLSRINSLLVLEKPETIFFDEFIFFE